MGCSLLASRPYSLLNVLRWFILITVVVCASVCLALSADTQVSAFAAILAGVVFVPILLWTRTWRLPLQKGTERRRLLRMLLGGPLVISSLLTLASAACYRP